MNWCISAVAPFSDWMVWYALIFPELEFVQVDVTPLGGDNYQVRMVVQNTGWLPSYVSKQALAKKVDVPISIDTYKFEVAEAALEAGAAMMNDITALSDERMGQLAAEQQVPVVLMHMQGTPATMQIEPKYEDVVGEVLEFLVGRAKRAEQLGISKSMIFIDPGIGFGKTLEHNLLILRDLKRFVAAGYRVLVGTSRKSFIGKLTGKEKPSDRIFGTAATVALCAAAGVSVVRVHDVAEMVDVVKVANKLKIEK